MLLKCKLAVQRLVVLLGQLAHNILIWARRWLAQHAPRLSHFGIVRLVQEVWAVSGRVKLIADRVVRVRLRPQHPRARDVCHGSARSAWNVKPSLFWAKSLMPVATGTTIDENAGAPFSGESWQLMSRTLR